MMRTTTLRSTKPMQRLLSVVTLAVVAASFGASASFASTPSDLAYYTIVSAQPGTKGAVTCTDSSVMGNIGSSGARPAVVLTRCQVAGDVIAPVANSVLTQLNTEIDHLNAKKCTRTLSGTLAGVTLDAGTYCFAAAASLTGTLHLRGSRNAAWTFQVNGDLTGKSFAVVMDGAAQPCNVYWVAKGATTMTTSDAKGNMLANQAITFTGGSFIGRALAKKAVTMTNVAAVGCH